MNELFSNAAVALPSEESELAAPPAGTDESHIPENLRRLHIVLDRTETLLNYFTTILPLLGPTEGPRVLGRVMVTSTLTQALIAGFEAGRARAVEGNTIAESSTTPLDPSPSESTLDRFRLRALLAIALGTSLIFPKRRPRALLGLLYQSAARIAATNPLLIRSLIEAQLLELNRISAVVTVRKGGQLRPGTPSALALRA